VCGDGGGGFCLLNGVFRSSKPETKQSKSIAIFGGSLKSEWWNGGAIHETLMIIIIIAEKNNSLRNIDGDFDKKKNKMSHACPENCRSCIGLDYSAENLHYRCGMSYFRVNRENFISPIRDCIIMVGTSMIL